MPTGLKVITIFLCGLIIIYIIYGAYCTIIEDDDKIYDIKVFNEDGKLIEEYNDISNVTEEIYDNRKRHSKIQFRDSNGFKHTIVYKNEIIILDEKDQGD